MAPDIYLTYENIDVSEFIGFYKKYYNCTGV